MNDWMLNTYIYNSYDELSMAVAKRMMEIVKSEPEARICVATGESPKRAYRFLSMGRELFQKVTIIKLDEWGGIPSTDPSSCETYIMKNIIEPLGLRRDQLIGFNSEAENKESECSRVKQLLKKIGPIDLCILGMGTDGHVGLNFPEESLIPEIHTVPSKYLTHAMINQAQVKPTHGYTLGMKEILSAKEIILIVSGEPKKRALSQLLEKRLSPSFPASFLWLSEHFYIYCDKDSYGVI